MRLIPIVFALGILASSSAFAFQDDSQEYYRSTDGSMVHRPTKQKGNYGHVTAICEDGSRSFSHHARGTCSHHGGVKEWEN
jgi:hypothetical protein